jgi:hypothetical protein
MYITKNVSAYLLWKKFLQFKHFHSFLEEKKVYVLLHILFIYLFIYLFYFLFFIFFSQCVILLVLF